MSNILLKKGNIPANFLSIIETIGFQNTIGYSKHDNIKRTSSSTSRPIQIFICTKYYHWINTEKLQCGSGTSLIYYDTSTNNASPYIPLSFRHEVLIYLYIHKMVHPGQCNTTKLIRRAS